MEFTGKLQPASATSHCHRPTIFKSVTLPLSPIPLESPPSPSPHASEVPRFCFGKKRTPLPKPLLDIEDVRAFFRSKLGSSKEINGHSSAKRVPTGIFGIGTMGSSGSDGGFVPLSSSQANEHQGQISSHSSSAHTHPPSVHTQTLYDHYYGHTQNGNTHRQPIHSRNGSAQHDYGNEDADRRYQYNYGCPPNENGSPQSSNDFSYHQSENTSQHQHSQPIYPLLDIEDVRDTIDSFLHCTGLRRHPTTSWLNKMPWHVPRAPFLAKGLEWPPESFESEEARQAYYRKVRKRQSFLLGSPPLWTVTALNLAFIQLLMYNPLQKFFDYLRRLP